MISENQIIAGCKDGKRHAFNLLYKKYESVLMGICFRYAKNNMESEDIFQEGFIKIFKSIDPKYISKHTRGTLHIKGGKLKYFDCYKF